MSRKDKIKFLIGLLTTDTDDEEIDIEELKNPDKLDDLLEMFKDKAQKKKHHPYRGLAIFTLAAAGMISVTNGVKKFVKEKVGALTSFMRVKTDK